MSSSSYSTPQGGNKNRSSSRLNTSGASGSSHGTRSDEVPCYLQDIQDKSELIIQFTANHRHVINQNDFQNFVYCSSTKLLKYKLSNNDFKKYLIKEATKLGLQFKIGKAEGDGNCFWYCLAKLLGLTVSFL